VSRIDAHTAAIATLTDATTTEQLAAALNNITDLRVGAAPGTAPGVPSDAEDGTYYNGFHFLTKIGSRILATAAHDLPQHTLILWEQLQQEQRDQREQTQLADELAQERRGRGRPRIGRPVPLRLPDWRITDLDRDAQAASVDRAELIRALIAIAYDKIRDDAQSAGVDPTEHLTSVLRARTGAAVAG